MDTRDLRDRYSDLLIDRIRDSKYPSKQLMDRAEATMADVDHAVEYADALFERITRYPSLQLLDRLAGLIQRIEISEWLQQQRR